MHVAFKMDCRKEPTEDQVNLDLAATQNNFERVNLIPQAGYVLVDESLKDKSEAMASLNIELSNYNGQVPLRKKSQQPANLSKWNYYLTQENSEKYDAACKSDGKYEDCKHTAEAENEVGDLRQYLEKKAPKRSREADTSPPQENSHQDLGKIVSMGTADKPLEMPKAKTIKCSSPRVEEFVPIRQQQQTKRETPKSDAQHPRKAISSLPRNPKNDEVQNDIANESAPSTDNCFRTANEELALQYARKYGSRSNDSPSSNSNYASSSNQSNQMFTKRQTLPQGQQQQPLFSYGASKKSLGTRRTVHSKFVPPIRRDSNESPTVAAHTTHLRQASEMDANIVADERLKMIEPKMIELISNEIMTKFRPISWNDIAGLQYAKSTIQEAVVWPMLRPDIFTGLRRPPRGILLFGPPGTGKTLIGKCIASQSNSTFFSISASSLTSKWIGDGEKMVRALFAVAAVHQPSVIFIDEVDSLLCQRSDTEHESSRRIKTEFLVQLDGAMTSEEERILIVGATNRPQELDEAARRRFIRRLYIPLPEKEARLQILENLMRTVRHSLTEIDIDCVAKLAEGYSGADMESLCREASMEPIRSIPPEKILYFKESEVRPISLADFRKALNRIRASVSQQDLIQYVRWNEIYGSGAS